MYMYGNTKPAFTTESLNDGCLRNLVGMKCSWPSTCIKMFWPYLPRGRSRARQNRSPGGGVPFFKKLLQTWRLQQQTEFVFACKFCHKMTKLHPGRPAPCFLPVCRWHFIDELRRWTKSIFMAMYVNKKMDVLTFIWFTSHVDKIIFSCINLTRTTSN